MGPFGLPKPVLQGFKERPEALLVEGNKLLLGTATGNLHIHLLENAEDTSNEKDTTSVRLSKTTKPIEALGFIKDISSLVALVDGSVSLFAFPFEGLPKARILPQTKGALCFCVHSVIVRFDEQGAEVKQGETQGVPSVVSTLAVGIRRKIVIYSWKDGEELQLKELVLPHTPRAIQFFNHRNLLLAYTATEHVTLTLPHMAVSEVILPPVQSTSALGNVGKLGMGMGNLGYWSMGMGGTNKKPILVKTNEGIFIPRDNQSILVGADGNVSTKTTAISEDGSNIIWPAPADESICLNPYVLSLFPPNTVPKSTDGSPQESQPVQMQQGHSVQIRSFLHPASYTQTFHHPFITNNAGGTATPSPSHAPTPQTSSNTVPNVSLRLLTPSSSSSVYAVSAPLDRTQLVNEGTTVWALPMKKWIVQVDELLDGEMYREALTLMATLDEVALPEKSDKVKYARTLLAVRQFKDGEYLTALRTLAEQDINPARVLGLYPELVSGRMSVPRERWTELFGRKVPADVESLSPIDDQLAVYSGSEHAEDTGLKAALKSVESYLPIPGKRENKDDDESVALNKEETKEDTVKQQIKKKHDEQFLKSMEALLEYLTDRRRKVQVLISPPVNQRDMSSLSSLPLQTLLDIPSVPPSQLNPEELTTFAQIVDTALFTTYLVARPGIIGPFCRIGNFCEVKEVEMLLRAREKYNDLVSLYSGKQMHGDALNLLKEMSKKEDDPEEKLGPSIRYLQKLGPEHIQQIFESSQWILREDKEQGFQIFTSGDVELPRTQVDQFLETIDPELSNRYLHYLIEERGEEGIQLHNRLGLLLISLTGRYEKQGEKDFAEHRYQDLLKFLNNSSIYQTDRLYGALPPDGMFEARAILLGRLGRHESALDIYVHQLHDYVKAEEHCVRVYAPGTATEPVFLSLLRTFLRPQSQHQKFPVLSLEDTVKREVLLQPALDLIARHSPRLDAFSTLDILPPLVTAQDVRQFLTEVLRIPTFDTMIQKEMWKSRKQTVSEQLTLLESRRVKVTDSRICPNCQKRLGNTVIAVHLPRGDVTHYHCRDAYSEKLKSASEQRLQPQSVR